MASSKALLLLVSAREDDLEFARKAAARSSFSLDHVSHPDALKRVLQNRQNAVVLWDTGDEKFFRQTFGEISELLPIERVFSFADKAARSYAHLEKYPVFAHHFWRRFDEVSVEALSFLLKNSVRPPDEKAFENFFPGEKNQKIKLTRSSHKSAAVEAVQNHLTKKGLRGRLAAVIAQATDELILNAFFDAPFEGRKRIFHYASRSNDVEAKEGKHVEVQFAENNGMMGIAVTDFWGSLEKQTLLETLKRTKTAGEETTLGGVQGIVDCGLSLYYSLTPGKKTSAILVFPKANSYREFRGGFRFLSLVES